MSTQHAARSTLALALLAGCAGDPAGDAGEPVAQTSARLRSDGPRLMRAGRAGGYPWLGPAEALVRFHVPPRRGLRLVAPLADGGLLCRAEGALLRLSPGGGEVASITAPGAAAPTAALVGGDGSFRELRPGQVVQGDAVGRVAWASDVPHDTAGLASDEQGRTAWATADGRAGALDRQGEPLWSRSLGARLAQAPAVSPLGTVVVPTATAQLLALSVVDGSPRWTAPLGAAATAPPVLTLEGVTFQGTARGLEAFAADGSRRWALGDPAGVLEPALAARDRLYVAGLGGTLVALDSQGKRRWAHATGAPPATAPVVDVVGTVYLIGRDAKLRAIADEGDHAELRWSLALPGLAGGRPALAPGGLLVVPLADGSLIGVGRPVAGHGPTCEAWIGALGCAAACTGCEQEVDACLSDPACDRLAQCVLQTGCADATSCGLPDRCGEVVASTGGLSGPAMTRAVALAACVRPACLGGVQ